MWRPNTTEWSIDTLFDETARLERINFTWSVEWYDPRTKKFCSESKRGMLENEAKVWAERVLRDVGMLPPESDNRGEACFC